MSSDEGDVKISTVGLSELSAVVSCTVLLLLVMATVANSVTAGNTDAGKAVIAAAVLVSCEKVKGISDELMLELVNKTEDDFSKFVVISGNPKFCDVVMEKYAGCCSELVTTALDVDAILDNGIDVRFPTSRLLGVSIVVPGVEMTVVVVSTTVVIASDGNTDVEIVSASVTVDPCTSPEEDSVWL